MENFKLNKNILLTIFFSLVSIIIFINYEKIHCTKLGDLFFDKLLGLNSNCYERKKKGVINPSVENLGTRYLYVENKKLVKCPQNSMIIIVSGQSNSANFLKSFKKYKNKHYNYFEGKCYALSNPVLGAEGEMSSIIPAIAENLDIYENIIFITSGRGGYSIVKNDNKNFINYNVRALNELKKKNNYLRFFVWIQGESDIGNSNEYEKSFERIYQTILDTQKNKKNIELIITQTTRCKNVEDKLLRDVQKAISLSKNNTLEVINTDNLGNEFRYDDCHFNEIGIKKLSLEISNIIRKSVSNE